MKKILVERAVHTRNPNERKMSAPEIMLFAEKVEEVFTRQLEQNKSKDNVSDYEIITEWI